MDERRNSTEKAVQGYRQFLGVCRAGLDFRLTAGDAPSPFALCFGLFGLRLVGDEGALAKDAEEWASRLRQNVRAYAVARGRVAELRRDKSFLQLVAFSLSSLDLLGRLEEDPLGDLIEPLLPNDVAAELAAVGALSGAPQSGNLAMFIAVFLLHARAHLGVATGSRIDAWVDAHLDAMNALGYWGPGRETTHHHVQNGYHQYEIFEYLGVDPPRARVAADGAARLADAQGHFAPYPGGGGCYDFDAVFMLTLAGHAPDAARRALLARTRDAILGEQNGDGGFGESRQVRAWAPACWRRAVRHVLGARGAVRRERLRWAVTLMRPKHQTIATHWTSRPRKWDESNLWDAWFRMLTLARIDLALDGSTARRWGFLSYPGLGYHRHVAAPDAVHSAPAS